MTLNSELPMNWRRGRQEQSSCARTVCLFFIYIFFAALGLHCRMQTFSSRGEPGLLSSCGVLASHCGGFCCCKAQALGVWASVVVAHRLSPMACGISLDQGLNLCPLPWQALNPWTTRKIPICLLSPGS